MWWRNSWWHLPGLPGTDGEIDVTWNLIFSSWTMPLMFFVVFHVFSMCLIMDNYTCLSSLNINNPSREGFGCIHTLEVDNHFQYTLCDLENLSEANQEIVSSQKAEPRVRNQNKSHLIGMVLRFWGDSLQGLELIRPIQQSTGRVPPTSCK